MPMPLLIAAVAGYLLGALPFGYLVARAHGVDIFKAGSGNPGATNVRRVLGKRAGNLVFILDVLKGAAAVAWPIVYLHLTAAPDPGPLTAAGLLQLRMSVTGLGAALIGHSFSCFTRFRGGKGVATGVGGFAVLFPLGALIAIAVFALVLAVSRYVSLASILGAATLPLSAWLLQPSRLLIGVTATVAAFVAVRHRPNLVRLLNGTENRIGRKKEHEA